MLNYQEIKAEFEQNKNKEHKDDQLSKFLSELKIRLGKYSYAFCFPYKGNVLLDSVYSDIYITSEEFHALDLKSQEFKVECRIGELYERFFEVSL